MFYSQIDEKKLAKDEIKDDNMRISGVYAKNRKKMTNSGLISKNARLFRKIDKKKENSGVLCCFNKKIQVFINDLSFFQEGFSENDEKISVIRRIQRFFKEKSSFLQKKLFFFLREICEEKMIKIGISRIFSLFFVGFLAFYLVFLPINVAYKDFPKGFLILDVIFLVLLIAQAFFKLDLSRIRERTLFSLIKYENFLSFLRISAFFSYLLNICDFFSIFFLIFSFEEFSLFLAFYRKNLKIYGVFLIFYMFLLINSLVCLWEILVNVTKNGWFERHNLVNLDFPTKYLISFNYIINLPFYKEFNTNRLEQIFAIFCSFLAFSSLFFMAISFNQIYQEINKEKRKKWYFFRFFLKNFSLFFEGKKRKK